MKNIFFLMCTSSLCLQQLCKFSVDCPKNVEGVDCTNMPSCVSHNPKLLKFEKAIILTKMVFSFLKRQVHIFSLSATIVQSFRMIAKKLWEELIIK